MRIELQMLVLMALVTTTGDDADYAERARCAERFGGRTMGDVDPRRPEAWNH
jgi:hypothetical protein